MAFLCPVRIKRNKKKKPLHDDSLQGPVPSMGRITGSASIETLVRVGIEKENGLGPESKMVVLHDFTPCVDDELEVKRGQIVHVLYQENDWVYVISEENKEGFIPHSYCAHFGSQLAGLALNVKKKLPRDASAPFGLGGSGGGPGKSTSMNGLPQMGLTSPGLPSSASSGKPPQLDLTSGTATTASSKALEQTDSDNSSLLRQNHPMGPGSVPGMLSTNGHRSHQSQPLPLPHNDPSRSNSLMSETSSQPDIHPFYKEPAGRFIVLYTYQAQDENDLSVDRGQCVTVLNSDDPDWCWVSKYDQSEGFVPAGFIYPLDAIHRHQNLANSSHAPGPQMLAQQPHPQVSTAHSKPMGPNAPPSYHSQGLPPPQMQPRQQILNNNNLPPHNHFPQPNSGFLPNDPANAFNGLPNVSRPMGSVGSSGPSSYSTSGMNSLGVVGSSHSTPGLPLPGYEPNPAPPPLPSVSSSNGNSTLTNGGEGGGENRFGGTELVMLYDYKAQAPDDLSVRRGDWVYADLSNQTVDGWLWSYSPKTRKYGFIPRAYARPPAMTSL